MSVARSGALAGAALVLDFGSVISFSVFERHAATERRLGLPANSIDWWGPVDPERDPLWRDMLAEKLTERAYWARLADAVGAMVGQKWRPVDFLRAARSSDLNEEIRPEIVALVEEAAAGGARLGVLSNELELFYGAEALADIRLLGVFDTIVDATHTGILKPDPRAYRLVLEQLGVPAERAVFVDDQPRNVAGARAVGMEAVFFDVRDPAGSCRRTRDALRALARPVAAL